MTSNNQKKWTPGKFPSSDSWKTDLEEVRELLKGSVRKRITEFNGVAPSVKEVEVYIVSKKPEKYNAQNVTAPRTPRKLNSVNLTTVEESNEPAQNSKSLAKNNQHSGHERTDKEVESVTSSGATDDIYHSRQPSVDIIIEPLPGILSVPRPSFKEKSQQKQESSRKVTFLRETEQKPWNDTSAIMISEDQDENPKTLYDRDNVKYRSFHGKRHDHTEKYIENNRSMRNGELRSILKVNQNSIHIEERDDGVLHQNKHNSDTARTHRKI